ncbi:hypothetical protein K490DRAFT_32799 [Saccharata proteae CBS 121410]|uniref:RING-type domain-containing protein n=1 Tax=Saccharata proteae CBS 121410 TaxID=1314787 RepID=A0A9P4I485_9PEZI|nr:hypothetical protein K490DRAFT_32799 [Saccharata proteae CBS 121410]
MVPERGASRVRNSLRRRRSPLQRNEDNAAMLSRLLSVAAAATAASLMGDEHRAGAETRNFMSGDEDGTFESFLQSLQNGRIASALRGNSVAMDDGQGSSAAGQAPLNFFRMFRFGNNNSNSSRTETGSRRPASNRSGESDSQRNGGEAPTNRMVPVIIVGIRSITPANGSREQQDENIPPFLDALHGFPAPSASPGDSSVDGVGVLRQPHNGTRFSHRRRASMGGVTALPSISPSPRPQRSVERPRPWSTLSDSASGPRPPPSTPASQGLSAFSSGATTPTFTPPATTPMAQSAAPSRRESFVRSTTRTSNGLESTAEEPPSPTQQRTARHRRLSESDFTRFGAGSARRNGVVEPDHTPGEGPRSWIIYVLGGSYPEDHPILTTPSLFTDTPTYEDMMLLSTFLGPAKPPVASEDDVASAGGLFTVEAGPSGLVAVSADNENTVPIAAEQRCLVCLCDFEVKEEARQLVKCGHLFHKECIDQWLTTGRNSCPLCRGQGVDEKEQPQSSPSSPATSPSMHPETDEGLAIPLSP